MTPFALVALVVAVQAPVGTDVAPDVAADVAPDPVGAADEPGGPSCWPGVAGAGGACAGLAVPVAPSAAMGALLWNMYAGAAAGTCVGATPAVLAVSGFGGILAAAVCAGPIASTTAAAGVAYVAQAEGRDPTWALVGATPGLACGWVGSCLSWSWLVVGTMGGPPMYLPALFMAAGGVLSSLVAGPCAACGASVGDGLAQLLAPPRGTVTVVEEPAPAPSVPVEPIEPAPSRGDVIPAAMRY